MKSLRIAAISSSSTLPMQEQESLSYIYHLLLCHFTPMKFCPFSSMLLLTASAFYKLSNDPFSLSNLISSAWLSRTTCFSEVLFCVRESTCSGFSVRLKSKKDRLSSKKDLKKATIVQFNLDILLSTTYPSIFSAYASFAFTQSLTVLKTSSFSMRRLDRDNSSYGLKVSLLNN
jgi:hypothetical protein